MRRSNLKYIILLYLLLSLILSSCGPSSEELAATSAAKTVAAATDTPVPTLTPSITPTPTLTPTPLPDPDPGTMIDLEELDLPESFRVQSPDDWGIEPGAIAFGTGNNLFTIHNSFVFADESRSELVFGYTAVMPDPSGIEDMNEIFANFLAWFKMAYDLPDVTLLDISEISGANGVGDQSAGVRIEYTAGSNQIVNEQVVFRIGDILGTANVKNFQETDSSVTVVNVAEVYARNISYPINTCEITKVTALDDMPLPTFDFQAAGFYPFESVLVLVDGEVLISGERYVVGHIDGLGDEMASVRVFEDQVPFNDFELFGYSMVPHKVDHAGVIHDTIMQTGVEAEDVVVSKEHKITVYGLYSGCSASVPVTWEPAE